MRVIITPSDLKGSIKAIASKSAAHRLLICAAFADGRTRLLCEELSRDIEATADCLRALGSNITYDTGTREFTVDPIPADDRTPAAGPATIDVGESGSTLRFLLPVVCALGRDTRLILHGRLPERPLSPLWEELEAHGCTLTKNPDGTIDTRGQLQGGSFTIAANISSQFISGLLFALPLLKENGDITLTGNVESEGYIRLTLRALEDFGIRVQWDGDHMSIPEDAVLHSPGDVRVEGDWSNGAFWVVAGALSREALICTGLDPDSIQGDRAIVELTKKIQAGNAVIDARDVPDLVPVMSVLASVSPGTTVFTHAERLRIKESDRIRSTREMLTNLGADAEETEDGLIIHGRKHLTGGRVQSCNDHRIAMSAAVASLACTGEVIVEDAGAVSKSYPAFWEDFQRLGGRIRTES